MLYCEGEVLSIIETPYVSKKTGKEGKVLSLNIMCRNGDILANVPVYYNDEKIVHGLKPRETYVLVFKYDANDRVGNNLQFVGYESKEANS